MSTILKIDHVTKKFEGLTAVNDLSIDVESRCIHALIGPNGSGKSTTVNLITGVYPLTSGEISFNGSVISGKPSYQIAQQGVGRTFQNIKLFGAMTVFDNLKTGAHKTTSQGILNFVWNFSRARREEEQLNARAEAVLRRLDLWKYKDEMVKSLPYGLQKMTELGRTLMAEPKLILLDEPAAGLNPSERADFIDLLKTIYADGIDLLLIEHNMDVVLNISHKITVINFGTKIAEGEPQAVVNDPAVIKAYLGDRFKASEV